MFRFAATVVLGLSSVCAMAQMTPVGLWKTVDDKDGSVKSEVRISEKAGVVSGKIERHFGPQAKPDDKCVECKDERKDQAIAGLEILRAFKKADDKDVWEGGNVLDPVNGKVYKAMLTPIEGGQKLQMRGYVGVFYRTQTWIRAQ